MAKFDPKKADLNKDGVLSDYEENVGKTRAAAMRMGHSPKKMDHAMKMDKSPMYNYKKGYAMQMGSREIDSPSAFNMKDAANIAASPMMNHEEGHNDPMDSRAFDWADVAREQIKHYYPGSEPYYISTVKRGKHPFGDTVGDYKGDYIPGIHAFGSSAELRDMSKMKGANIAAKQGQLGAKRTARVIRGARGASNLDFSAKDYDFVKTNYENFRAGKPTLRGNSYGHLDAESREMFKRSRGPKTYLKKSTEHAKNLAKFMQLEFEGVGRTSGIKSKGKTFNQLKGNTLTSLPAGVPDLSEKPKKILRLTSKSRKKYKGGKLKSKPIIRTNKGKRVRY